MGAEEVQQVEEGDKDILGCLLYVDDTVILSENNDTVQTLLEVVEEYGRDF